ncbi:hypothetical protein [Paracoccus zhejiangensis]|uniref:Uncharacterized protein n=1 Tax=Paracoccus zhejiangensis TaxID=1077935 RepID=A0A2H5F609_9RHOB|nr:hypothetical protein [Paracoccus zhejiangensis]AUH66979.1 hypothetical protein CX676_22050 [Paracoccus zhejiangensis]
MAEYRLGSSSLVHTPGLIAWGVNGYYFEEDRPQLLDVIAATYPGVPREALEQVLLRQIDYRVEGETVVFAVEVDHARA